jgi:hypothetical protein
LARKLAVDGRKYHHGEELKDVGLGPDQGSVAAAKWLDEPGPMVCENVIMARATRKWLARNPTGLPADLFIQLDTQVAERVPGQSAMAVGCRTVWDQIEPELVRRGAKILRARL